MIDSAQLLADLKRELRNLEDDLRVRAEDRSTDWGAGLRAEHARAQERERTGLAWIDWRDGEVSQAAVAWIIATVFIRFAEDNNLLKGVELDGHPVALPWVAAPGHGLERAVENEAAFYAASPTSTSRDWLQQAFRTLSALPAGRPLVDPDHSPVWHAPISASASDALLTFFRKTTPKGTLVHDFRDPELGTRFLGDLYQDLSEYSKKTFALLQTPIFVEEFILDLTLTPAIAEFGLAGLKLIDPTCGSGHFLLGAFERLTAAWRAAAPALDAGERVQRALDSIHGVDLNPFAVAIARFRVTVAAIGAAGIPTLVAAPAFRYHLAIGDSLLGGIDHQATLDIGEGEVYEYAVEDLKAHHDILKPAQYHVVVGNPPYIQVKDPVLNKTYRDRYPTCAGKYALSVPFMELFFRLARKPEGGAGAGYVGQITSNSFMKREFGKKLIEQFLSGVDPFTRVDLTHVIDTSGAYIPGHGTPTVILAGRRQKSTSAVLRAVLSVRGGPTPQSDPAQGATWREIVGHLEDVAFDGTYVTIADVPRDTFATYPWSLSGGDAGPLKAHIEAVATALLRERIEAAGITSVTGEDSVYMLGNSGSVRRLRVTRSRPLVEGRAVRDYQIVSTVETLWPYRDDLTVAPLSELDSGSRELFFKYRWAINRRKRFGTSMVQRGLTWWEWQELYTDKLRTPLTITFAFIATHNHFVLDRGGKVFNRTAPVIKLAETATEEDHYGLLGVLNSSTSCFWLKQVTFNRGDSTDSRGARVTGDPSFDTYEFTGSKLEEYPLPTTLPAEIARQIDSLAATLNSDSPRAVLGGGPAALTAASDRWVETQQAMIALQEELDWQVYASYGLVDASLAPMNPEIVPIEPNERPFEVRLARAIADGSEESAWFDRHGRPPLTNAPNKGSQGWRDLWRARYEAAESGFVKMLERPEYKRRWAGSKWEELVAEAVVEALLDRLESPELWRDSAGRPVVRSTAQVADDLRRDQRFRELLTMHFGSQDFDLTTEVGRLMAAQAVPGLAALRYKESGLEKFRAWERTWELQRAEDRGERVTIPVPPKYVQGDFLKTSYWSARGTLDVPKERFISFPGSELPDDTTELYGWAGWDHGARGLAIAALANNLARAGAPDEQVVPLVGVLLELEPWLKKWHDAIDARAGVSLAAAIAGITTSLLGRLGIGRDTVVAWRPAATPRRGRRSAS